MNPDRWSLSLRKSRRPNPNLEVIGERFPKLTARHFENEVFPEREKLWTDACNRVGLKHPS
jgi:hypothetical protein